MNRDHPLPPRFRPAALAIIAAVPALIIGFYVGIYAGGIGSPRSIESIFLRGLVCATPATVIAILAPRFWLLPGSIYGFGFYSGYTFLDGIGTAFVSAILAPFAALTGKHLGPPPTPAHPELIWILGIALWLTAFASFLRRHDSPEKKFGD